MGRKSLSAPMCSTLFFVLFSSDEGSLNMSPRNNTFELAGFIRVTLTDKAKEEAKKSDPYTGFEEYVGNLAVEGYKLSLAWDSGNDCFYATLTQTSGASPHLGKALSGRGPTITGALQMLFQKHFVILKGDWSKAKGLEGDVWG
jgi:hypothetical protein